MFYTGSLGYFAQLTALTRISEISSNAHLELAAGYGTFGYEPKVDYLFGFPIGIKAGGVALDIPMNVVTATNDGNKEDQKNFKIQFGILSSALEHATPEQMFNDPANPTEAISAVKALQIATAEGQRIYQITQANIDSVMPNLNLGAGTKQAIKSSVAAGLEVITHTDRVSVPGYTGEGYIILDPETGDGAYMIAGGGNGGWEEDPLTGISVVIGTMAGTIDGYSNHDAKNNTLPNKSEFARIEIAKTLAKIGLFLGGAAVFASLISALTDNSLSIYDVIGQISVAFLGFGIGNIIGAGVSALAFPLFAALLSTILIAFVSILLAIFVTMYFTYNVFREESYV